MDRLQSTYRCLGAVLLMVLLAGSTSAYVVGDWTVVQLTDNETDDSYPRVSGDTVVWSGIGATNTWEIFMWRDGVTSQLTDNVHSNVQPRVHGDLVVWTVNLNQVYAYDGTVRELTPSYQNHQYPETSMGTAAWIGRPSGSIVNIFYYDGADITQLTDTSNQKYDVRISGSTVVWWGLGDNGTGEIFYHDGVVEFQLTDNAYNDKNPRISDGGPGAFHLTYESLIDGYWDILHFDGATTVNLTDTPTIHEYGHQICGDRTVWQANNRIWLHDGTGATPISPEGSIAFEPQVSDSLVTWWASSYGEIYVYDGSIVTRLTDNGILIDREPKVDGGTVVWHGTDGYDDEIFMAYKTPSVVSVTPEAHSLTVFGASPNPFNPATEIVFANSRTEELSVAIFDLRGHLVADLVDRVYSPGKHRVAWQGTDGQGQAVPSGVYFYMVKGESERQVGKMTLVE